MPLVVENVKNYFETLKICSNENSIHNLNSKDEINDTEVNGLFTDVSVEKALKFINDEYFSLKSTRSGTHGRTAKQQLRTLELIMIIYQLHGKFEEEYKCIKLYNHIAKLSRDTEDQSLGFLRESFYHLIHDSTTTIPEICVQLTRKLLIINSNITGLSTQNVLISFAKLIFEKSNPDFKILFDKIQQFYTDYRAYFIGNTLESHLVKINFTQCEFALKVKAFRSGYRASNINFVEDGFVLRKLTTGSIEYLRKKNSDMNLHSGSYETLRYLWNFINGLLIGLQLVAEYYTLAGIEKESKQYQTELFSYSVRYCVPYRTKMAVKLFMHCEFLYLRIPELTIRDSQLTQLKTNHVSMDNSIHSNSQRSSLGVDIVEYNYPLQIQNDDQFLTPFSKNGKSKKPLKKDALYLKTVANEKEITFEDCFLSRSTLRTELLDIYNIIKSHIWKIQPIKREFFVDNAWEMNFIETSEEAENNLSDSIFDINLSTPPSSPKKNNSVNNAILNIANMNAPIRTRRIGPNPPNKPTIYKKSVKDKENDSDGTAPIENFQTVFIPGKPRNIKYEDPELPRSLLNNFNKISIKDNSNPINGKPSNLRFDYVNECRLLETSIVKQSITQPENQLSLIDYLEEHVTKFKYVNVPILHRPIYQRLALHYLSSNSEKTAYYLSMSIGVGFRQLYLSECLMKARNRKSVHSKRWQSTYERVFSCMESEPLLHCQLNELLPKNWTVFQFNVIDEIPISCIKSSLLNNIDGGCFGARNCAVLLVTKYQNVEINGKLQLTIETRVMHGFRKTGMQLLDQLEHLKVESSRGLKITDRKSWWAYRFKIDSNLKSLIDQMRCDWFTESNLKWLMDQGTDLEGEPKIIITDREICRVPMESILIGGGMNSKCITRMPNMISLIGHLHQTRFRNVESPLPNLSRSNLEIDPMKTFYVVNPDDTLQETEDTILPIFKKQLSWEGVVGKSDKRLDTFDVLSNKEMLIYCGHGAGGRYFMGRSYKSITSPTSMFLIGCQSSRFTVEGRSEAFGMIMYYLTIGCPSVFGLLWDVTDREIDKFTVKLLSNWLGNSEHHTHQSDTYLPVAPMPAYVFDSRTVDGVQLKTLTGNSPIVFGLPTWSVDEIELPKFE